MFQGGRGGETSFGPTQVTKGANLNYGVWLTNYYPVINAAHLAEDSILQRLGNEFLFHKMAQSFLHD